ncbi:MAG: hypothetical protein K6F86_04850 [Lachnospiraceae bacterium]|nr:hypothetical protein [Lachnospiraceae bacterium]
MKKVNMFLLDWLIVPVWCLLFPLGEVLSAVIMMFVTAVFCYLNYRNSKKTVTLFLEDINLMGAAVLGILLNNLLYIRFIYADREKVSAMVLIIFLALVYLTFIMIFSMTVKEIGRRRRRRIINKLASPDHTETDESYPDDDEEYDDDDGYDDDDDDAGFETERRVLASMSRMSDNGRDGSEISEDDEEDSPEEDDESKGPKFKVIKKARK